jgi:pyridoxamine 5'-phosphate oxidase
MAADHKPDYYKGPQEGDFAAADEPFELFTRWMADAKAHEINDPHAMALATVDKDGMPNVRMVLMNGFDPAGHPERGFVFYTNFESAKGQEALASGKAALVFHWKSLRRQVRVRGPATQVKDEEADAYFATRPRGSQVGAWASQQSRPLESRFALEKAVASWGTRYAIGAVPRPPHWSGFRVTPLEIEFWHDRPFRLHERIAFRRAGPQDAWAKTRLYP